MTDTQGKTKQLGLAVIGGGLTGKMMALTLAQCGEPVVLFAPSVPAGRADRRSTTIHEAGRKMLDALGVLACLPETMTPITGISVAIGAEMPRRDDWLLSWSSDDTPMAYVVENAHLDKALDQKLAEHSDHITIISSAIINQSDTASGCMLQDEDDNHYLVSHVVACDGAVSQTREKAGVKPVNLPTGQLAIIANLRCEIAHDNRAYQRFLESGPLAVMPLSGNALSLVWSVHSDKANQLLALDEAEFSEAVTAAFGTTLGKLKLDGTCRHFPLKPHYIRHLTTGHITLAGDAAHAIHPLAGMGYNLALADAAILLDELKIAKKRGLTIDHLSIKKGYQRRRAAEILAMTTATSGLNALFSRPKGPLGDIMATAMAVLDKTALKKKFRDLAMGGKLSDAPLLRGQI